MVNTIITIYKQKVFLSTGELSFFNPLINRIMLGRLIEHASQIDLAASFLAL
jgi:hypothetical protein